MLSKGLRNWHIFEKRDAQNLGNCVEAYGQTKLLSDDSHPHVNGDSDPNWRFDRILGDAIEGHDSEMLLDLFEEQFDPPAGLDHQGDGQSRFAEVVGQEHEFIAGRRIGVPDAA